MLFLSLGNEYPSLIGSKYSGSLLEAINLSRVLTTNFSVDNVLDRYALRGTLNVLANFPETCEQLTNEDMQELLKKLEQNGTYKESFSTIVENVDKIVVKEPEK